MEEQKSALDSARDFIRQREEYKSRLLEELKSARARVAEIEEVLQQLSGGVDAKASVDPPKETVSRVATDRPEIIKGTIPDYIGAVLRASGHSGMTSGEIANAVRDQRELPKTTIFPTIYRMAKDGRLRTRGDRYYLAE